MLAVAPVEAGRAWGGLLTSEASMFECARVSASSAASTVWNPPSSPAFAADRQAVSPMVQSLPAPKGSLVRRRPAQSQRRIHGTSKNGRAGVLRAGGSNTTEAHTLEAGVLARTPDGGGGTGVAGSGGGDINDSTSAGFPRPQDHASREDGSRLRRVPGGGRPGCPSGGGGGSGGGTTSRGSSSGSGEGWTKSSMGADVWGWAGFGGGAARGHAMLSAYGIQSGRHCLSCPRGTSVETGSRHNRWQHGQGGGGRQEFAVNSGGGIAMVEEVRSTCARESSGIGIESRTSTSGSISGTHRRGVGSCGGASRLSSSDIVSSDRKAHVHGHQRFRGCKGRTQRPSAASSFGHTKSGHRLSSSSERARGVWVVDEGDSGGSGDAGRQLAPRIISQEEDSDTCVTSILSPRPTESLGLREHTFRECSTRERQSRERAAEDTHRHHHHSANHFRQAFDNLLVPTSCTIVTEGLLVGISPSANQTGVTSKAAGMSADSALLAMDGRGGTAAPPYRPPYFNLRASAVASPSTAAAAGGGIVDATEHSQLFPGLVVASFDADINSCGRETREGSVGGDDGTTPPVSLQRAHSHNSPWLSKKHPRGIHTNSNVGGDVSGRCRRQYHDHAPSTGDDGAAESDVSAPSFPPSEPAGDNSGAATLGDSLRTHNGTEENTARLWAISPAVAFARSTNGPAVGAASVGACSQGGKSIERRPTAIHPVFGQSRVSLGATLDTSGKTATITATADGKVGLGPFERSSQGYDEVTPQSEVFDRFKLVPRPTSRRGTRQQGADGEEAQPAFCLFSGHRGSSGRDGGQVERGIGGAAGSVRRDTSQEEAARAQTRE